MSNVLEVLVFIQWVFILGLCLALLGLARQVGVLHRRLGPAGALMTSGALKVGSKVPEIEVRTVAGKSLSVGAPSSDGRSTLIAFVAPDCPVCTRLMPVYKCIAQEFCDQLELVFASDAAVHGHELYRKQQGIEGFEYVLSTDLGMQFEIGKLPYAVLIDPEGVLVSQGLVNSREHIESLLEAQRLKLSSINEYFELQPEAK
jgi:methylamine dehydrogenase accessory protein MauD